MKKVLLILLLSTLVAGCHKKSVTVQMDEIDSLVIREQYDSAYAGVLKIDSLDLITREDSAHYQLLVVQTGFLTNHPDSLTCLDSLVIPYYIKVGNHEKLAEAYYYKAYGKVMQGDIPNATFYYKAAEEQAVNTENPRLRYKIAESLSYTNEASGNYALQLDYARKAFSIAEAVQNKEWMAYALCRMSFAYTKLHQRDSAVVYMNRAIPYTRYVSKDDRPTFLTNAAYTFKHTAPETAKRLLEESLSLSEHSVTMQHLADIYRIEGNLEGAYQLWIKALSINDGIPKDIILQNILEYDIEHGLADHFHGTMNEIIHVKDSIINSLRNDTIKDLQLRFDHEVAMRQQEQITSNWQKGVLVAVIFVLILTAYIIIRRIVDRNKMQEVQMQISDYMSQIHHLEASGKEADEEIGKLRKQIKDYLSAKAPEMLRVSLMYEQIKEETIDSLFIAGWSKKDEQCFNDYYTAIDYATVNRLRKVKRKEKLSPHKLFYLLLVEMGKSDEYIAKLLGIGQRSVNVLKSRTKPIEESL